MFYSNFQDDFHWLLHGWPPGAWTGPRPDRPSISPVLSTSWDPRSNNFKFTHQFKLETHSVKDCGCGSRGSRRVWSAEPLRRFKTSFGNLRDRSIFLAVLAATFPCLFGTSYRFPTSAVAGPIPSERPGGGCIQQWPRPTDACLKIHSAWLENAYMILYENHVYYSI